MVDCNDHGRALEYCVALGLERFLVNNKVEVISSEETKRLNFRDKPQFDALPLQDKEDFARCSLAINVWLESKGSLKGVERGTIDRLSDDKASKNVDPTDIKLVLLKKDGSTLTENLSIKNHHDALKHPRLPSLPQQCGISKGTKEDKEYRRGYAKIWEKFGENVRKNNKKITGYEKLDSEIKFDYLYVPLMKHTTTFLNRHLSNSQCVSALFEYLVGKTNYTVIKNEPKEIVIKDFSNSTLPTKASITYPYSENDIDPRSHLLLEFNNGWKIRIRIHNASGRIFKENGTIFATEKMDPICINLTELIKVDAIEK